MTKRYDSISIGANEAEKEVIAILAKAEGAKPASIARQLLYRGIEEYLKDQKFKGQSLEHEIFRDLVDFINSETRLKKAKELIESEKAEKAANDKPQIVATYALTDEKAGKKTRRA
jgi:hypothetical protein